MSITSSKISFGTQFKAHIGANHAARHLHLKKLGNKQKNEKVVQSILTSAVDTLVFWLLPRGPVRMNAFSFKKKKKTKGAGSV